MLVNTVGAVVGLNAKGFVLLNSNTANEEKTKFGQINASLPPPTPSPVTRTYVYEGWGIQTNINNALDILISHLLPAPNPGNPKCTPAACCSRIDGCHDNPLGIEHAHPVELRTNQKLVKFQIFRLI